MGADTAHFLSLRAKMTGSSGISSNDASLLSAKFAQELREFDLKKAMQALDGLRARHRGKLSELGVPALGGDEQVS
jgi:hypothetical protein